MVDAKQIKQLLKDHFLTQGKVSVNDQGVVDVTGSVGIKQRHKISRIPVQLGKVGGDFFCEDADITTLDGAPTWVGGDCWLQYNHLTSLVGAPQFVGGNFNVSSNRLTTLEGGPTHVGGSYNCYGNDLVSLNGVPEVLTQGLNLDYRPMLPLLRLLSYPEFTINRAPEPVSLILDSHTGTGKPGAIRAAGELIRAGYKGNARW